MSKKTIFSYTELRKFLMYLRDNFKVTSLGGWDGSNAVIMRHDVEHDLKSAYKMALLELECEVPATYFAMTTCHTYNLMSISNRKLLTRISDMGFEIGLHFDPDVYGDIPSNDLRRKVELEAQILESIINKKVKSISLHNPSKRGNYPTFPGFRNAYSTEIAHDDIYISDSCMHFRGKDLYSFVTRAKRHPVQILLHPIHYSEKGLDYPEIFSDLLIDLAHELDSDFRQDNPTYREQLSDKKLIEYLARKVIQEVPQADFFKCSSFV